MLFDESYGQLRKQSFFHLWFFFFFIFYFDDDFLLTVRVKRLHLRLFVWESLISFSYICFH